MKRNASWILPCGTEQSSCLGSDLWIFPLFYLFCLRRNPQSPLLVDYWWFLLVVGFHLCFLVCYLMLWIIAWSHCWPHLFLLPGDVFYCSLAIYVSVSFPSKCLPWWFSLYLMYTLPCFWQFSFVLVVDWYNMACFFSLASFIPLVVLLHLGLFLSLHWILILHL